MYLVDTNIWLERLLGQDRSDEVGEFLNRIGSHQLFISDFSFHSLCIILTRLKRGQSAIDFVEDSFVNGQVGLVTLPPEDIETLVEVMKRYDLDFDDAYQYVIAESRSLHLVSFDDDFRRTVRGASTPAEILKDLSK
jgi:predicted nucleic acid-binding protein